MPRGDKDLTIKTTIEGLKSVSSLVAGPELERVKLEEKKQTNEKRQEIIKALNTIMGLSAGSIEESIEMRQKCSGIFSQSADEDIRDILSSKKIQWLRDNFNHLVEDLGKREEGLRLIRQAEVVTEEKLHKIKAEGLIRIGEIKMQEEQLNSEKDAYNEQKKLIEEQKQFIAQIKTDIEKKAEKEKMETDIFTVLEKGNADQLRKFLSGNLEKLNEKNPDKKNVINDCH